MAEQWLPRIDQHLCTGCGDCVIHCPTNALGWENDKAALLFPARCEYCAICEDICPVNAIEVPFMILKKREEGNHE